MRLQEEKEEERKCIVKIERERMRKELRRKEWHYSVAFKASLAAASYPAIVPGFTKKTSYIRVNYLACKI